MQKYYHVTWPDSQPFLPGGEHASENVIASDDESCFVPVEEYDKLKPLDKENTYVCSECGGLDIQVDCWQDANTGDYRGEGPEDDPWCGDCNAYTDITTMEKFEKRMDKWFAKTSVKQREKILDLRSIDYTGDVFRELCDITWKGFKYNEKRRIYNAREFEKVCKTETD